VTRTAAAVAARFPTPEVQMVHLEAL